MSRLENFTIFYKLHNGKVTVKTFTIQIIKLHPLLPLWIEGIFLIKPFFTGMLEVFETT